jgi:mRNA-degrading endonuclease RelE of RelBE toxin-antitoxin system
MDGNVSTCISDGFLEIRRKAIYYLSLENTAACLESIWNPKAVIIGAFLRDAFPEKIDLRDYASQPPRAKRPPPWHIGMTSHFREAISKIDRKLQPRILEALDDITKNPTTIRGDVIKPLTGGLQGCWHYRLGDDRLVYFTNQSSGDITLLAFASDASIQGD